jgi:hypothetical protein
MIARAVLDADVTEMRIVEGGRHHVSSVGHDQ